jgi:Zn-dependent M28 family amino/carboxypeptidase
VTAIGVALGLSGALVATVLGAAGIVHLGLGLLALDWWRSPPVEGAIDNGSGMAVLVGVAEEVAREPLRHAELWVVATGDREPDSGGMDAFLFQFGTLLDPTNTALVNVDDVGLGALHIGTSEGRWDRLPYKPFVAGLAERLARTGRFGEVKTAELVGRTDAGPATEAGFSAVTLTCLVDGSSPGQMHTTQDRFEEVDPTTVAHAQAFTAALVRTLDRELAPDGPDLTLDASRGRAQALSDTDP